MTIDEDTYQGLFCGSPLAYLLVADRRGLGVGLSCMPDLNKPGGVANRRPLPMQTRWATRVAQF
jgi:hypothetical protein